MKHSSVKLGNEIGTFHSRTNKQRKKGGHFELINEIENELWPASYRKNKNEFN
jgi:hypothetical protein